MPRNQTQLVRHSEALCLQVEFWSQRKVARTIRRPDQQTGGSGEEELKFFFAASLLLIRASDCSHAQPLRSKFCLKAVGSQRLLFSSSLRELGRYKYENGCHCENQVNASGEGINNSFHFDVKITDLMSLRIRRYFIHAERKQSCAQKLTIPLSAFLDFLRFCLQHDIWKWNKCRTLDIAIL